MANSYNDLSFTSTSYTVDTVSLGTGRGLFNLGKMRVVDSLDLGDMCVLVEVP